MSTTRLAEAARAAAVVDDLIRTGRAAPLIAAGRDLAAAGWLDQLDAAATEITAALNRSATRDNRQMRRGPYSEHPEWVTLSVMQAVAGWAIGTADTCTHQPHPDRPQPVHAAAWRPGLIACSRCPHLFALPRGDVRDRTCDGCGHQCAGPDHRDGIRSVVIAAGALSYAVGVCRGCWWGPDDTDPA